ncbi:MAG: T9SS type A sorting domain-containing protein, partial [Bacteroidetes bacterium]|nr:T9SS type A sorting domain-containing protein [Fibrella sp.]
GQTLTTVDNQDSLNYALKADAQAGVRRRVILQARTATETVADTFQYTVSPQPPVAELPAGLKDGINYLPNSRVVLSLYTPLKKFVYAIGEFNDWQVSEAYLMNRTPDGTRYWIELNTLRPGQEVAFQYLVDGTIAVADPYADKLLDRNNDRFIPTTTYPNLKPFPARAIGSFVSVLQPDQTPYVWKTTNFQRPDPKNMVVYELLVRDFVGTRSYKTLTDTLMYLKRLGINTIELMPVMEFSGNDSWGYNPIFYFAPDKAYGTKNDLKAFIDKCHEMGMAVVLDMVLNQADFEFPYVRMYFDGDRPATNSPFFNPQATHPFSVFFDFNHESPDTKNLVDRVSQYWLQEYKMDGYRYDLSKGFTQKNSGNDVAGWGNYDASRVAIWKRIYDKIRTYDPTAYVILEHFADNTEETELANYGMLFWGNSTGDYRNAAKGNLSDPSFLSYKRRGWRNPNVIGYLESHDEERLVYDVITNGNVNGSYSTKNLATALERAKLAAAFFLPVPGPKLIWQFGELGYDVNIDQNGRTGTKPIRWEYLQDPNRLKLFKVYQELIKLKNTQPVFQTTDFTLDFGGLVKRMTLNSPGQTLYSIGNFDTKAVTQAANFPLGGTWYDYFTGQSVTVTDPNVPVTMQPGEFHLYTTAKLPTPEANLVPWTTAVAPVVTALDEPSVGLTVSPNPTADVAVVALTNTYRGVVALTLTNAAGQAIRTQSSPKTGSSWRQTVSLQGLPAGVYYLTVRQGDQQTVRKVMKL